MDPFTQTILVGTGLVICGYILGRGDGHRRGADEVMKELIESKLIDTREVLNFYASQGNVKAQEALERLNAARKAKFDAKD